MFFRYAKLVITLALMGILGGCAADADKEEADLCTQVFMKSYNDLTKLHFQIERPVRAEDSYRLLQDALAACDVFQGNYGVEHVCSAEDNGLAVQARALDHGWFCWHTRRLSRQPHPQWNVSQPR